MKLNWSLIFLTVLIASGLCDDTTTTTPASVQTTTIADTSASISQQPNITTVSPNTTTSQQPNITTVSPNTTTSQQLNTTTVSSSTTAATVSSSTTTQQPNATTIAPTTATNLPTSSSTAPPTTNATTASTTVKPVTSTAVEPTSTSLPDTTTTVKPTSLPPVTTTTPEPPTPVEGSWNVTEANLTCIRADLKVRFRISVRDHEEYIVLNPNATSSGSCKSSNTTQELQLEETKYTLTMIFEKDFDNSYLKKVTFTYILPDSSGTFYNDNKLFIVKIGNSYLCDSSDNINLRNVTMEIFRIHIQSFGSVESKEFGTAEECEADFIGKKDKVAPAVGIVLLVLVVVVLVAYFVERRRSQQKGYQTV